MKYKLPNQIVIIETHYTLDIINDRGSSRFLDICKTSKKSESLIKLDLNATNGRLNINLNDDETITLTPYQTERLIEFLSQRD